MNDLFLTKMKRSLDFTLAGNPAEAMRVIQEALGRIPSTAPADLSPKSIAGPRPISPARARKRASGVIVEAVILADSPRTARTTSAPARARTKGDEGLVKRHHTSRYGARDYCIHVPADAANIRGLIVMLHGCNQTALDFARGTRMTAAAETAGFVTVWPEQARAHNSSECWNWFRGGDQAADSGEPQSSRTSPDPLQANSRCRMAMSSRPASRRAARWRQSSPTPTPNSSAPSASIPGSPPARRRM